MASSYQIKDGSQVAPRRAAESPEEAPNILRSLAVAGLQADAPKVLTWKSGDGRSGVCDTPTPSPDEFPLRLIAAAARVEDLLSDPVPASDSARYLPTVRPSFADCQRWEESLRAFGTMATVHRNESRFNNTQHEFVVVFDADWLGADSCTFPKAPSTLITGRPDVVDVPRIGADGNAIYGNGERWPANRGEVSDWFTLTLSQIEVLAARGIEYRSQYVTARKVISGATSDQMSKEHKKAWGKVRFFARQQIEPTVTALCRGIEEYRSTIAEHRVLIADYTKSRN